VDARQDAGVEQIGQWTFEPSHGGGRTLVAPAALRGALDPGEVAERRAGRAVDIDDSPC
jgi:hypothetical protein